MKIDDLLIHLNTLLTPELFNDYCPNGLQVAGKKEIKRIVSGVSANQALLEHSVKAQADVILVHHGFFWKGEDPCITGLKHARLTTLINHQINLIGYHLPLDAHDTFGNNVQLAKILEIIPEKGINTPNAPKLIWQGKLEKPLLGKIFAQKIEKKLQRKPFYIPGRAKKISRIVWCTGGAQDFIDKAIALNADAYLTGEVSERTVSVARESGIHFYAAGHHATERYGVAALGDYLAKKFNLQHRFIDIDNPI